MKTIHINRIVIIAIFAIILSTNFVFGSNVSSDENLDHIMESTELSDEQIKGIYEEIGNLFDTYEITDIYKITDNAYFVLTKDENQDTNSLIVIESLVDGAYHYEILDSKSEDLKDKEMQEYIVKVYEELEKIVGDIETGNAIMQDNASEENQINVILILVGVAFGVFLTIVAGFVIYINYKNKD